MEDHRLIPRYTSHSWRIGGVKKRISSAHYSQSNGRAELAVKIAKRTLIDYTDGYGRLRHDLAARAIMTHTNTPHQDLALSPGRNAIWPGNKREVPDSQTLEGDQRVERKSHSKETPAESKALQHTQPPTPRTSGWRIGASAEPGGPLPRRWMKTGRVVETMETSNTGYV